MSKKGGKALFALDEKIRGEKELERAKKAGPRSPITTSHVLLLGWVARFVFFCGRGSLASDWIFVPPLPLPSSFLPACPSSTKSSPGNGLALENTFYSLL